MQALTVTANLIQLTRLRLVNAFLVREDDGFTLVDTMIGGSGQRLLEAARSAGGEIRRIALTHGHSDHVGSLDDLLGRIGPAAEISMGEVDVQIHAGEYKPEGKLPGGWPNLKTREIRRLKPGDRVGSLEVVDSPGHTPGHISFIDARDRSLIAGDVYATVGGIAVSSHVHWKFPLPAMATWDKALDLRSALALRALDPSVLVVGHGQPVRNPAAAMDGAIARAQDAAR